MDDGLVERENTFSETPGIDAEGTADYADLAGSITGESAATLTLEQATQASQARVVDLEVELAAMRDRWMRAEAETANIKARAKKDIDDVKQYGTQKLATDIVEAAENLRRGLNSVPEAKAGEGLLAQLRDGFAGVERSFVAMLDRHGIKRHDPTGNAFDAGSQQAMSEQESSSHLPGTVLRALSSTWTLNGRLLRPAMVIVAKSPTTHPDPSRAANATHQSRTPS